jgi:type I restriction enzyme R subunit
VFCVDEEHDARMRQALINENKDLCNENHRCVMRITGSDMEGQAQLGNFIDPEAKYPVLVTTSRLLSTGVDACGVGRTRRENLLSKSDSQGPLSRRC